MAATSFAAIRDNQVSLIEALAPAKLSSIPFRAALDQMEFVAWANANPDSALRRFSIRNEYDYGEVEVSNSDLEYHTTQATLLVAYPKTLGLYGQENLRDMDDFIEQDMDQLDDAIGHRGNPNYVDGQHRSIRLSTALTETAAVAILSMTYELGFYRSV